MHATFFFSNFTRILSRSVSKSPATAVFGSRRLLLGKMEGCVLECLQRLHDPIPLPDNTPVRLGRTPKTQITEPRCSRLQVEVQVSWKTKEIKVTQLGANTSAVDGNDLERGKTMSMSPDSTLFILKGMYPHKVVFIGADKEPETPMKEVSTFLEPAKDMSRNGKKRSADATNGIEEDYIPAKKHKSSKHREDEISRNEEKEKVSRSQSKEANRHERNGSKSSKKDLDSDKATPQKVTDFFTSSKTESKEKGSATDIRTRDHHHHSKRDRETSSDKKEKRSDSNSRDKDGKSKKDKHKNDSKTERKSSLDTKRENSKRSLQDMSDDDDAHVQAVSEKLQQLKQKARTEKVDSKSKVDTLGSLKSSDKRKTSAELTSTKCKVGKPAAAASWEPVDGKLYIFTSEGTFASEKIAGFDIDGTIITTQSGRVFPKDMDDWKVLMPQVFGKLKQLVAANYKIVFFTNQLGVGRGKVQIEDLKNKFEKVVRKLQVPVQIFISTSGGSYRKPALGMWQTLKKQKNDGISIKMADSFYVGDAAGREANWAPKKKKDFSCGDRLFAINAGLKFYTPEEFFMDQKAAAFKLPDFDPRAVRTDTPLLQEDEPLTSDSPEVVVFVGLQASGKSSFAKTHLIPKGYVHINQDTLKTWQKCVIECQRALEAGKSVVIDNTNVEPETRARYIDCAKRAGKPCRCFYFDFSVLQCRHNERFREITNKEHKPINEQIFNSTKSKFKPPEAREGFSKIIKVNFVPLFPDKLHEKIYRQFLLEK